MKPSKSLMMMATIAIAIALTAGLAIPTASARPRRPPAPPPSPAPAAAVVTDIVINEANSGTFWVTNPSEFGVDYIVRVAGPPIVPVPPFPGTTVNGYVSGNEGRLTGLSPSTSYTVTVFRQRFYDPVTNQAVSVSSAPTSFTFTTPSLEATRPSAPQISLGTRSGSRVLLNWAPSTDNVSVQTQLQYTYAVAGDPFRTAVPTCGAYCFGTTGTSIALPAPGTSITVTVTAIDGAGLRSLPSNPVVITG